MSELGPYEIEELLGEGGMGIVHRARHRYLDHRVALKVLRRDAADAELEERFLREIKVAASLDHPHLAKILDGGRIDQQLFLAMELVEGETLEALLSRERQLPWPRAVAIAAQVADALAYLHGKRILHRDIKPANILLTGAFRVKIVDFGLTKQLGATALTVPNSLTGTLRYLPPEALAGQQALPAWDRWALGCILYEMVAGVHPIGPPGQGITAWMARLASSRIASLEDLASPVPPELARLISSLLALAPEDRPGLASHVLPVLKALLQAPRDACPAAGVAPAPPAPGAPPAAVDHTAPDGVTRRVPLPGPAAPGPDRPSSAPGRPPLPSGHRPARPERPRSRPVQGPDHPPATPASAAPRRSGLSLRLLAGFAAAGLLLVLARWPRPRPPGWSLLEAEELVQHLGPVPACARYRPPTGNLAATLALCWLSLGQGELEEHRAMLGHVLQADPDPLTAAIARSLRLHSEGKRLAAIAEARLAVQLAPSAPDPLLCLGHLLDMAGDLEGARDSYERLRVLRPAARAPALRLASLHLKYPAGHPDLGTAARILHALAPRAPQDVGVHNVAAALAELEGRLPEAEAELRAVTALDPLSASTRLALAAFLARRGLLAEAEREHRRALELEPGYWPAAIGLGHFLLDRGRQSEARQVYGALIGRTHFLERRFELATLLCRDRGFTAAFAELESIRRAFPQSPQVLLAESRLFATQSREADELDAYREAVRLDPQDPGLQMGLSDLQRRLGRSREALLSAEAAVHLAPNHAGAHLVLGLALQDSGDFRRAEAELRLELAAHPASSDAALVLGNMLLGRHAPAEAECVIRPFVDGQPGRHPHVDLLLASLLAQRRFVAFDAVVAAEDRDHGDDPEMAFAVARRVLERGPPAPARARFHRALRRWPRVAEHMKLADWLLAQDDPTALESELASLLEQHPEEAKARYMLVRLLDRTGRSAQAEERARTMLKARPDPDLARYLAGMLRRRGPLSRDDDALVAASKPAQASYQVLLDLARWDIQFGSTADAEGYVREAIAARPTDPDAHRMLSRALLEQGRFSEVDAALKSRQALGKPALPAPVPRPR